MGPQLFDLYVFSLMPLAICWSSDIDQKQNVHTQVSSDEFSSEDTLLPPSNQHRRS